MNTISIPESKSPCFVSSILPRLSIKSPHTWIPCAGRFPTRLSSGPTMAESTARQLQWRGGVPGRTERNIPLSPPERSLGRILVALQSHENTLVSRCARRRDSGIRTATCSENESRRLADRRTQEAAARMASSEPSARAGRSRAQPPSRTPRTGRARSRAEQSLRPPLRRAADTRSTPKAPPRPPPPPTAHSQATVGRLGTPALLALANYFIITIYSNNNNNQ
jgi:hypothetical protein